MMGLLDPLSALSWREREGAAYVEAHRAACRDRIADVVALSRPEFTCDEACALARRRLAELRGNPNPRPSVRSIIAPIASAEGLSPDQVSYPSRQPHFIRARWASAIAIRTAIPDMPVAEIARILGYANSWSVSHILRKARRGDVSSKRRSVPNPENDQ